ncbi:MAG TPA: branched-chain amino acid ABC transporter permease [Xanthobacteraceae bacterium]|nr:branched-chain amino acid ABC transporter permease [Xanthobacteraceae bacterium]
MSRRQPATTTPSPTLWWGAGVAVAVGALLSLPRVLDPYDVLQLSVILILSMLALSEGFLWGFVGILSFGQTTFFGLGGYAYAVTALNVGHTELALLGAVLLAAVFAALVGYFMIYGRISNVYLGVITLVITLILEKLMRATSSDEWVIGSVRLNGQNGIPTVPSLDIPFLHGTFDLAGVYYISIGCLAVIYVGLRLLLATHFGRVCVGIRENEVRAELLGYDSRIYKLTAFVLAGAVAGFSGALFGIWGNFVSPDMFSLSQSAQILIWVIVGGRTTLVGPIIGCALVQYLTSYLGAAAVGQVTLFLGLILMVAVLAFRQGLVPTLALLPSWFQRRSATTGEPRGGR